MYRYILYLIIYIYIYVLYIRSVITFIPVRTADKGCVCVCLMPGEGRWYRRDRVNNNITPLCTRTRVCVYVFVFSVIYMYRDVISHCLCACATSTPHHSPNPSQSYPCVLKLQCNNARELYYTETIYPRREIRMQYTYYYYIYIYIDTYAPATAITNLYTTTRV